MLRRATWFGLILLFLLLPTACARSHETVSAELLNAYHAAADPDALASAIDDLVASQAGVAAMAQGLRTGRTYPADEPTGWTIYTIEGTDGRTRPYHVYIPTSYDPQQSYPVLFDLHGAVSTAPQPAEYLEQRRRMWEPEAEEYGWILIVPHGDRLASWFSADGHANLLGELAYVKRHYNVNENKVFISGFSDGGSGAFWQAFHDPTPWAAMISFHGHPAIGGYGPYQSYPRNLLNRPIRATTGEQDELYPPDNVGQFIELFKAIGVDIDWIVYPGGHEAQFLLDEAPYTVEFIGQTARDPYPDNVIWETSHLDISRCDWVRIDEIADVGNNANFPDVNIAEVPDQVVFGASLAYHGGTLFTVAGLEPGSAAHIMGIKNGDQIMRIDDLPVLTQTDIGFAMLGKLPGDPVEAEIIRNGETLILTGTIPTGELIYRRDVPSACIQAVANGNQIDVSVRNVGHYTLFLSSEQFDLSQPIVVTTNGEPCYSAVVATDVRFMLEQSAADLDRRTVYEAALEITVAPHES